NPANSGREIIGDKKRTRHISRLPRALVARGTGNRHGVYGHDLNRNAVRRGVNNLAVTDVHSDVGNSGEIAYEITWLQFINGYRLATGDLCLGGARNGLTVLLVGPVHQTGAIKRVGASCTPVIRRALLG